jgi:hypothetical protein
MSCSAPLRQPRGRIAFDCRQARQQVRAHGAQMVRPVRPRPPHRGPLGGEPCCARDVPRGRRGCARRLSLRRSRAVRAGGGVLPAPRGDLLTGREFGGCEEEPPQFPQPPESPQDRQLCDSAFATAPQDVYPPHNQAPNAEGLGLVEPERMAPDMILASVADDPEVKEAAARWDAPPPSTHYDLVRARDEAQARTGIPVAVSMPIWWACIRASPPWWTRVARPA